jgi:hypothetical protein
MKKVLWAVFVAASAALIMSFMPLPATTTSQATQTVTYDVACDGNTFTLNRQDVSMTEKIKRGDTFVLNGKIYPGGTIPSGGSRNEPSSFGPDQGGSIGTWFCRGAFLVGSEKFDIEKIQRATTQYFALNDKNRLITEGFEGSSDTTRVILGGVGQYYNSHGLVSMERIGINATGAYNMRFTFNLE